MVLKAQSPTASTRLARLAVASVGSTVPVKCASVLPSRNAMTWVYSDVSTTVHMRVATPVAGSMVNREYGWMKASVPLLAPVTAYSRPVGQWYCIAATASTSHTHTHDKSAQDLNECTRTRGDDAQQAVLPLLTLGAKV